MIRFSNGHEFEFVAAAGSLGFDGRGWWWEKPLRWAGIVDPSAFTVVVKTLTWQQRVGNLKMWCPWRCVRLVQPDGAVNAVGLTNPGFTWWTVHHRHRLLQNVRYMVSIAPDDVSQAVCMTDTVARLPHPVVGVELNVSCPNSQHGLTMPKLITMVQAAKHAADIHRMPLVVKLGHLEALPMMQQLDGLGLAAFDIINTIPWHQVRLVSEGKKETSPLAKYGLEGGVSGRPIRPHAEIALDLAKQAGIQTPLISGGGVMEYNDVAKRFGMGADAVAFGTLFLRRPWAPNQYVRRWHAAQPVPA